MSEGGQTGEQLPLPPASLGNPTAVAETVEAELPNVPAIGGIITISQADADSVANGIAQAGGQGRVGLGGFDMNATSLDRIRGGTRILAIDRHPHLRGALTTSLPHSHAGFGTSVPTGQNAPPTRRRSTSAACFPVGDRRVPGPRVHRPRHLRQRDRHASCRRDEPSRRGAAAGRWRPRS